MKYLGKFFDGQSSKPHDIEVEVNYKGLRIYFINKISEGNTEIFWQHSLITHEDIVGDISLLKYGTVFPFPTLEINSVLLLNEVKQICPTAPYLQNHFKLFSNTGLKGIGIALFLLLFVGFISYTWLIPAIMVTAANVFPKNIEIELGDKMKDSFVSSEDIDSQKTFLINKFYANINCNSTYPIYISVVKSDIQNAYALPGGNIIIFTALLDSLKTSEQLVALIGHETGHIYYRHTLKMLFKSLANYIIISAIFQDVSGILSVIVDHASSIENLSYNRTVERESDAFGYAVMKKNSLNPKGMLELFNLLNRSSKGDKIPAFLSTHPQLSERIIETKKRIEENPFTPYKNDSLNYFFEKLISITN